MHKKLLFIFSSPPFNHLRSLEGLDAVFAAAAFDQTITTLFLGDGVYQWMANIQSNAPKNIAKILASFELYDLNPVYIQQSAWENRHIPPIHLPKDAILLSDNDVARLFTQADHIFRF